MWVVKIGGSLGSDPLLPQWLELLAQLGGGRVTLVCGGGSFADEVRRAQALWGFDDLAAHNMAVLAMAQNAYLARGLSPALQLATSEHDIRRVLHGGQTAVWLPMELLHARPTPRTNWHHNHFFIRICLCVEKKPCLFIFFKMRLQFSVERNGFGFVRIHF